MSDVSSRNLSSRVFHVDRECYVVYVGTTEHRFRPFLRLGTSPWLPDKVKRHISNVVISDHLTGNPQYERQCLEHPVSHDMRYVGTTGLVNSVKQFVHDQTIASRPISPPKGEDADREGAHVLFYSDGNVRIIVDGKEVLDLRKRERDDRHAVFELRRLNELAGSSTGAYFASSFSKPGFIYGPGGSLVRFNGDGLELHRLAAGDLDFLAKRLIPLELIRRISGPQDREGFVDLCKWKLRQKEDLTIAASDGDRTNGEIEELITLLSKAGLKVEREHPEPPAEPLATLTAKLQPRETELSLEDAPKPPTDPNLSLPPDRRWIGDYTPALLPGLPYELNTRRNGGTQEAETLRNLLSDALRKEITLPEETTAGSLANIRSRLEAGTTDEEGSADLLLGNLLLWNLATGALLLGGSDEKELTEELRRAGASVEGEWKRLLNQLPLPVNGTIHPGEELFSITYSLPPGFTKGRISENRRVYKKIETFLARREDPRHYHEERRRLETFLGSLIEKQQVAKVAAPKPPPETLGHAAEARENTAAVAPSKTDDGDDRAGAETQSATPEAVSTKPRTGKRPTEAPQPAAERAIVDSGGGSDGKKRVPALLWAVLLILLLVGGGAILFFTRSGGESVARSPRPEASEPSETTPKPEEPGTDSDRQEQELADGSADGPGAVASVDEPETAESLGAPRTTDSEPAESGAPETGPAEPGAPETGTEEPSPPEDTVVAVGNGGYVVTILDILVFVNRVARENGYAPIGQVSPDSRDPDWIFPGNEITLPDGSVHTVRRGDTLWDISRSFLLDHVDEHYRRFLQLQQDAESGETQIERLENLQEEVYVASLREAITAFLQERRE